MRLVINGLPPSFPFALDDRAFASLVMLPRIAPRLIGWLQCGQFISFVFFRIISPYHILSVSFVNTYLACLASN